MVRSLRAFGHEVYDFREPIPGLRGFAWSEIDPEWINWTPAKFRDALNHPIAQAGFKMDKMGMDNSEVCVLLLPCGRSAHAEAGYMAGQEKPVIVCIPEPCEPELMYGLFGNRIATTPEELFSMLDRL